LKIENQSYLEQINKLKEFETKYNMLYSKSVKNKQVYETKIKEYEVKLKEQKDEYENKLKHSNDRIFEICEKLSQKTNITNNNITNCINNITKNYFDTIEKIDFNDLDIPRNPIDYMIYKEPEHIPKMLANHYANETFLKDKVFCTDFNRNTLLYCEKQGGIKRDPEGKEILNYIFTIFSPELKENLCCIIDSSEHIKDKLYVEAIVEIYNYIKDKDKLLNSKFYKNVCDEFSKAIPNKNDIPKLLERYREDQPSRVVKITFNNDYIDSNAKSITELLETLNIEYKCKVDKERKNFKEKIEQKNKEKMEKFIVKSKEKLEEDHRYMQSITDSLNMRRNELEEFINVLETEKSNIMCNKHLSYDDKDRLEKLNKEIHKLKGELRDLN